MNRFTTIIIPSYRSKILILRHIKKFSNNFKIIIVENSNDIAFKKLVENKYQNVDIYLKKNIGYGRAVNFASQKVRTKYFFVMNPDTKIYKNTLNNLICAAKKINQLAKDFTINKNIELTISSAKPPIFWKDKEVTKQQIFKWSPDKIKILIYQLSELELIIKKNINNSINFVTDFILDQSTPKTNN